MISGLCRCGCMGLTKRNKLTGEWRRYRSDHAENEGSPVCVEVDCGYDTPCWIWQRTTLPAGYGRMGANNYAHRVYYERFVGPIPEGLVLDHLCNHPSCVNPAHLEPVTHQENIIRGRVRCPRIGRQQGVKLTAAQVNEIRRSIQANISAANLAAEYGVTRQTIHDIKQGKTWRKS